MKKVSFSLTVLIVLLLVLSASLVYAAAAGVKTKDPQKLVELYPPEITSFSTPYSRNVYIQQLREGSAKEGFARLSTTPAISVQRADVEISVKNLPKLEINEAYEAWLVDVDSGYQLTLGMFKTDYDGDGDLHWVMQGSILAYDKVVITKEVIPDANPMPSGKVVLVGDLDLSLSVKGKQARNYAERRTQFEAGVDAPGYVKRTYEYTY